MAFQSDNEGKPCRWHSHILVDGGFIAYGIPNCLGHLPIGSYVLRGLRFRPITKLGPESDNIRPAWQLQWLWLWNCFFSQIYRLLTRVFWFEGYGPDAESDPLYSLNPFQFLSSFFKIRMRLIRFWNEFNRIKTKISRPESWILTTTLTHFSTEQRLQRVFSKM